MNTKRPQLPTEPIRTCIGCRRKAGCSELVRFTASEQRLVEGANSPGRGAWLCRASLVDCFDAASANGRWAASLRQKIDPDSVRHLRSIYDGFLS